MEDKQQQSADPGPEVIFSDYETIPEIAEILNVFVDSLPQMLKKMHLAMEGSDLAEIQAQAHQLKGSGGGYGYPMVTEQARKLETAASNQDPELVRLHLDKLGNLCAAIERGWQAKSPTGGQT